MRVQILVHIPSSTRYPYTYMVVRALFCCILGPKSKGRAVGTWPGPPGSLGIWCHKGPIKLTLSRKVVVGVSWKSDQFVIDWAVLYLQKPKKIVGVSFEFSKWKTSKMVFWKKANDMTHCVQLLFTLHLCAPFMNGRGKRKRVQIALIMENPATRQTVVRSH